MIIAISNHFCLFSLQFRNTHVASFEQDGMAFGALVANWRPDLLDFDQLKPGSKNAMQNLTLAFHAAERMGVRSFVLLSLCV